jgi:hypothetical protein
MSDSLKSQSCAISSHTEVISAKARRQSGEAEPKPMEATPRN